MATSFSYERDADLARETIRDEVIAACGYFAYKQAAKSSFAVEQDELRAAAMYGVALADSRYDAYCEENGFDPAVTTHYRSYLIKRALGSMLDFQRGLDYLTRSDRTDLKAMQAAGEGAGVSGEEISKATGLSRQRCAQVRAVAANRPMPLDYHPAGASEPVAALLAEPETTESHAAVNAITAAAAAAVQALPEAERCTVMLRYYYGLSEEEIAQVLDLDAYRVGKLRERAILAAHSAMLREALAARLSVLCMSGADAV